METFTIREAAERCEVSYQLMRKRVDRGTVRVVKRDGVRRIPRSELERAGLWPGSQPPGSDSRELESLRSQLAEATRELTSLRPQLAAEQHARELAEDAAHEQRAAATTAAARLGEAEQAREDAIALASQLQSAHVATIERLTNGNVLVRWRARRELRAGPTEGPAPADTVRA
jgi:hypothetical protein